MVVVLDMDALRAAADSVEDQGLQISFAATPRPTQVEALLRDLSSAVSRANEKQQSAIAARPTVVHGSTPVPTGEGATLLIPHIGSWTALSSWASAVADMLTAHGWDGRLTARARPRARPDSGSVVGLSSILFTRGWRTNPDSSRRVATAGWTRDQALRDRVVALVRGWMDEALPTRLTVKGIGDEVDASSLTDRLDLALAAPRDGIVGLSQRTPATTTSVVCDVRGRVVLFSNDGPSPDLLDRHLEALRTSADICEYALTRHNRPAPLTIPAALQWQPGLPTSSPVGDNAATYYQSWRHLDTHRVPDAYGIQLLGPGHTQQLPSQLTTDGWASEQQGDGMMLMTARELDPWLTGVGLPVDPDGTTPEPIVDEAVLDHARRDLQPIILIDAPPPIA